VTKVKSPEAAESSPPVERTRKWYVVEGASPPIVTECDVPFAAVFVWVEPYDEVAP
jgi:hypothetical protein